MSSQGLGAGPTLGAGRRRERWSQFLLVVSSITLALAVLFGWIHATVFRPDEFAARATELLDSSVVRATLAETVTDQIVQRGPSSLVSYRSVIIVAVEAVVQTDAFKQVFKKAVRSAHDAVFAKNGDSVVLNLVDSMNVIRGTLEVTSPDVAKQIPTDVGEVLVDLTNEVRGLALWQVGEELGELVVILFVGAIGGLVASVALSADRRRGVSAVGLGVMASAGLVLLVVAVVRHFALASVADPDLRAALGATIDVVTGDLRSEVLWLVGYGLLITAVANSAAGAGGRLSYRSVRDWVETHVVRTPRTRLRRVVRAGALLVVGFIVITNTALVITAVVMGVGALLAYVGAVEALSVLGRSPVYATEPVPSGPDRSASSATRARSVRLSLGVITLIALVTAAGAISQGRSAAAARDAAVVRCNGHAELCDRRVDEVVFAASHNSMSAARELGWLFGEHLGGIRAQLEFGIRGFLIDTHYGVPSGIKVPGSDIEIVLTDKNAEVNRDKLNEQLSAEQAQEAADLARRAGSVTGKPRGIYLCHNFCELGATPFNEVLHEFRSFLTERPNEVVILIIEDYVTAAETAEAFAAAGLADRIWTHSPGEPWPTLGEMIATGRQILVFSEHQSPPPAWYHPAYESFEETPYTFRDISEFNCEPNRGGTGRELFLLNHWLNTGSPDLRAAEAANQREVLQARIDACRDLRGRIPNLIAVDFYDQGDLLAVVADLNGVEPA